MGQNSFDVGKYRVISGHKAKSKGSGGEFHAHASRAPCLVASRNVW